MSSATAYLVDLAALVTDPVDTLTYILPHPTSSWGSALSLTDSTVTYTPPGLGPLTDGFTYVVADGKRGHHRLVCDRLRPIRRGGMHFLIVRRGNP